jgi:hypothetical protein
LEAKLLEHDLAYYASQMVVPGYPIGEISPDRTAVIGRNNWCFIYEGGNKYRQAYADIGKAHLGGTWANLIERRRVLSESLQINFLQLIVPNKATVMPDNFPEPLSQGITPILSELLRIDKAEKIICPLSSFRTPALRESIFRRNDSHLTIAGNAILAELILEKFKITLPKTEKIAVSKVEHVGDDVPPDLVPVGSRD